MGSAQPVSGQGSVLVLERLGQPGWTVPVAG